MITEKLIFKIPYEIPTAFHPSQLTGGQLYLRKDQATVSSWVSDIGIARDFVQGVAGQQPTISTDTVDFDGINDIMLLSESNLFGSDSSGIMFLSGYFDGNFIRLFTSSWSSSDFQYIDIFINSSGNLNVRFNSAGTGGSNDYVRFNEVIPTNSYFYVSIESIGVGNPYIATVNGVLSANTVILGADNGKWFDSVPNRNSNTLGGRVLLSGTGYTVSMLNKNYYNNTALTALEKSNMQTFMSDPTNY